MDNDGFTFTHALYDLPAALGAMDPQRDRTLVVGVTGTDDGYREALVSIRLHEKLLAGYLVARVLPVRVGQGRRFAYKEV